MLTPCKVQYLSEVFSKVHYRKSGVKVGISCVFAEGARSFYKELSFPECVEMLWNTEFGWRESLCKGGV